jgi:uncharacterized lipoprotein YbaY
MRSIPAQKLLAHISLFLVLVLLLAACGTSSAGPTPAPGPSIATQADAFLEQQIANHNFSCTILVSASSHPEHIGVLVLRVCLTC